MQVKDEVLHKVRIVPDDQLKQVEGAYVFDVSPQTSYSDRVVYMPHAGENFGNVGFLKLKLLCQRKGIHLTTFGHLNQFTEMAILGDSVIAQPGDKLLDRLYCDPVSGCRVDQSVMRKVTGSRYIHGHEMSGMSHNYLISRGDCDPSFGVEVTPELREKHSLVIEAMETVDDHEVIETFVWPDIYIRQSTWEIFQSLQLADDVICCEAKLGWGFSDEIREWLRRSGLPNVRGFEQVFQHNLLRKVGAHYMGIQFLASWLKNWTFVCIGGSANLFSIVPVKGLILFDTWFNNSSTEVCLRGLAQRRYGSLGNDIPVFLPKRQMFPIAKFLDLKKDLLAQSLEQLRGCRYGV